ncbi:MAG: hypothetical protein IJU20_07855 [Clostridia bacterium]|nr:hypothetical protein [Clostridia bacterium]
MNQNTDKPVCTGICPCASPCPISLTLKAIGGKWKPRILCTLYVDRVQHERDRSMGQNVIKSGI